MQPFYLIFHYWGVQSTLSSPQTQFFIFFVRRRAQGVRPLICPVFYLFIRASRKSHMIRSIVFFFFFKAMILRNINTGYVQFANHIGMRERCTERNKNELMHWHMAVYIHLHEFIADKRIGKPVSYKKINIL